MSRVVAQRACLWKRIWVFGVAMLFVTTACGAPPSGDPGPSWKAFETMFRTSEPPRAAVVVVVDDRDRGDAAELRTGIGSAVRALASNLVADYAEQLPDPAPWHPVDMRVVIVPASSVAVDAAAGPVNDPKLVWATVQATEEGAEAIGRAVDAAVQRMETSSGAHFRPLERAHDIAGLLTGGRAPANAVEAELVAATLPKPKFPSVAVSVVAASDDESPEPAESYRLDFVVSGLAFEIAAGIVTPGARHQRDLDVARFPRLSRWAFNRTWSPFIGCGAEGAPFTLFEEWCVDYRYRCDGRPIEQLSPGLGSCYIETTTVDPPACAAERGWADPKDSDGVRRPHVDERGEHVCEVMPVEPRYMDACIHDETCADCGNGWCVTETRADERFCGPYFKLSPIRWVGGALPAPGTVRITCREPQ